MIKVDIKKLQKDFNTIEHDFKVIKILLIINGEHQFKDFQVIEQMIAQTKEYLLVNDENAYNIIDNNVFELENILSDLKDHLNEEIDGNIYLLLMNNNNYHLDNLLNLLNQLTTDYPLALLKNDIKSYYPKIINDYLVILKAIIINELSDVHLKVVNALQDIIKDNHRLTKVELQYIYKETKSLMKYILEQNLDTNDLNNKHYLFELTFIILMVD